MSASNAGRIGVWGRSGSGKSSYVKQKIKARKRLIIFDPLEEYGSALRCRTVHSLAEVKKGMRANWTGFRLAFVPTGGKESDQLSALSKFLMRAQEPYKASGGRGEGLTLVVEEMNIAFPVAGGEHRAPGFADICSRGRHYGIEVFGLSQRIAEVATRFRGNCTETVVLKQKGPRDIDAAANELGTDRARVVALDALEYLHEKDGIITAGKITFGRQAANTNAAPKARKRAA